MCQKKNHLYTNNMITLVCCSHHTDDHIIFKMCGITMRQKNKSMAYVHPKQIQGYDIYRVLIKIKWRNMPPDKCIIESKWDFKKKRDSQFRARLVVRGYTQILGVYFTNKYSPVVTNVTLCVILLMWLLNKR